MSPDPQILVDGWLLVLAIALGTLLPLTSFFVLTSTRRAPQATGPWAWTMRVRKDGWELRNFEPWGTAFGIACIGTLFQSRVAAVLACIFGITFVVTSAHGIFNPYSRDRVAKVVVSLAIAAFVAGLAVRLVSSASR